MTTTTRSPNKIPGSLLSALCVLGVLPWIWGCGAAEGETSSMSTESRVASPEPPRADTPLQDALARARIPDVVLLDQDGREVRFYSDLVRGKRVLMNAIYTTCSGTCPAQTSIFTSVQRHLKQRPELADVQLISVSLDPLQDRPARLKEFAEKYGAQPGWAFLTGSKENVQAVLEAMDLYAAVPEQHTPICALGNEPTGVWMKLVNLATPDEIVSRIEYVTKLDPRQLVAQ
ncbi:MAG: SCO family protein [Planctomycetes bacterium]|nr:SCO family protein [Planctomycetota bacterium]